MKYKLGQLFLLLGLAIMSKDVLAGACIVNLSVKNVGSQTLYVSNALSKVKVRNGYYRALSKGHWSSKREQTIKNGRTFTDSYRAQQGCNKKRRYRIEYRCGAYGSGNVSNRGIYYPSTNGWTTKQSLTINISCDNT